MSFNVFITSDNKVSGNTSDAYYTVKWNTFFRVPTRFKVRFAFASQKNLADAGNILTNPNPAVLFCSVPTKTNNYLLNDTGEIASGAVMGLIQSVCTDTVNGWGNLQAKLGENPAVEWFLNPDQTQLRVILTDLEDTLWIDSNPLGGERVETYVLILEFTPIV